MRADISNVIVTGGAILALLCIGQAHGHGLGGAGVAVLASDGQETPLLVRLTTGLAIQTQPGVWQFICEARWGGIEEPQMITAGGSFPAWVIGLDSVYTVDAEGEVRLVSPNALTAGEVLAVAAERDGPRAVALAFKEAGSALWRLDGPNGPQLWLVLSEYWSSITTTPSGITLGRVDAEGALWTLSLGWDDTQETDAQPIQWMQGPPGGWLATVRFANGAFFVSSYDGVEFAFWSVDLSKNNTSKLLTSSQNIIRGPVQVGADLWVLSDHRLGRLKDTQFEWEISELTFDCLGEHRASAFACAASNLWKLDTQGLRQTPWFEASQVRAPLLDDLDSYTANRCNLDWRHFAEEAGIDPDAATPDQATEEPPSSGDNDDNDAVDTQTTTPVSPGDCACRTASPPLSPAKGPLAWLCAALLASLLVGRRPQRPSNQAQ